MVQGTRGRQSDLYNKIKRLMLQIHGRVKKATLQLQELAKNT